MTRPLDAVLRPAVTASVLVAEADGYAFRHELFREALWEHLLPGERAQPHRGFAEALEAEPPLSPDYLPSVQLAVHWCGAGEHEPALRAAWAAARARQARPRARHSHQRSRSRPNLSGGKWPIKPYTGGWWQGRPEFAQASRFIKHGHRVSAGA